LISKQHKGAKLTIIIVMKKINNNKLISKTGVINEIQVITVNTLIFLMYLQLPCGIFLSFYFFQFFEKKNKINKKTKVKEDDFFFRKLFPLSELHFYFWFVVKK